MDTKLGMPSKECNFESMLARWLHRAWEFMALCRQAYLSWHVFATWVLAAHGHIVDKREQLRCSLAAGRPTSFILLLSVCAVVEELVA